MGSESDVATHWKTHLIIGKNFSQDFTLFFIRGYCVYKYGKTFGTKL